MTDELNPVIVAGECSEPSCQSEVIDDAGSTVFSSLEALIEAARAAGWWAVADGSLLACPNHVRRYRGHVVGERFDKGRRDLGIRAVRWYEE